MLSCLSRWGGHAKTYGSDSGHSLSRDALRWPPLAVRPHSFQDDAEIHLRRRSGPMRRHVVLALLALAQPAVAQTPNLVERLDAQKKQFDQQQKKLGEGFAAKFTAAENHVRNNKTLNAQAR